MTGKLLFAGAVVALAACSQLGGSSGDTYQHALAVLCQAPASIMQNVLTTPELKAAWLVICTHIQSVPPTPVNPVTIAERSP